MASDHQSADTTVSFDDESDLTSAIDENEAELAELLRQLAVAEELAADLAPELRESVRENREPIRDLRVAVEREEALVLLERLSENADTLAELLDLLDATHDLAMDLAPELRDVARDNRNVIRDLRMAATGFADAHDENEVEMYELGRNAGNMIALVQTLGDPQVTDAIDATVNGLATDDPKPVGFLGLLKALFDADVRRALGRLLAAARGLGSFQEDTED